MPPLAAIVRSSDRVAERQREGTYHGDTDQIAEVDRYCAARGLPYVVLPPELDISGGKPIEERPSLQTAIEGVERGDYSGIVAANLKRLTRSRSGLEIWTRVEAAGGSVHTAAEATDTSTPNGRFMRDIFLADAVREREEHAVRHAQRRAATVAAGMWRVHKPPRGYEFQGPAVNGRYKGKARRLVPGAQADGVRAAAQSVIDGESLVSIADRLAITPSGVRAMLRNRAYLGELRDGTNLLVDAHEPILSPEVFAAVQHALATNPRPPRRMRDPALLAGLVRCAACGHAMTRRVTGSPIYICPGRHSGGRCPAPAAITLRLLDEYVENAAMPELERLTFEASQRSSVEDARRALADARAERDAYVVATSALGDGFAAGAQQRADAVAAAEARLDIELARQPALKAGDGVAGYLRCDPRGRNRTLRGLLACIIVERSGGRGHIRPIGDRVRILRHGASVVLPVRHGSRTDGLGIIPLPLPDPDDPSVLRVLGP